tara:strand:+ start:373 stop:882 length:510 start_codon:yes stop_codon:yes gene_type:complete
VATVIVKMVLGKRLGLIFGLFLMILLTGSGIVSASYYGGNYGYENYNPSYSYGNNYGNFNYGHSYGNSYKNFNYKPNIVSISSSYKDEDHFIYRTGSSSYRSNSHYPGFSGVKTYDREYVIDKYYPYYSYVTENSFREGNSPYGYSKRTENNRRLLSRPEHYLVYWSYL